MSSKQVNRRDFIKIGGASTLALTLSSLGDTTALFNKTVHADNQEENVLRFHPNGKFKVVQFNDTQDDERIDRRTLELMEKVLDAEKPDFVVLNGDNITGGCDTPLEMKQAMNNIAQPMEKRGIKWAVTFGNHDEDSTQKSGIDESKMLEFYRSYEHNLNQKGAKHITGTGNMNLLIWDADAKKAAFNLWLLDSGRYAPKTIAAQDFQGYPTWDWLRFDQVSWYNEMSQRIENRFSYKVPSLMFIHIPLWEHRYMWYASVDSRTEADHARAVEKHQITGERNEDECPGPINSGLFSAMQHRGDVKGVFCGHDHINTYAGNYYGIMLGYGGSAGFGTYGLPGAEKNRLRGARVFNLDLNHENVLAETHMVFAKDFGIDLTANDQSMDPATLPEKKQTVKA
jgi:3',5'-cyclic AMP phosphodiesterase CpdA